MTSKKNRNWKEYRAFSATESCRHCGYTIHAKYRKIVYKCPCGALKTQGDLVFLNKPKPMGDVLYELGC